jgi:hypothetical protein
MNGSHKRAAASAPERPITFRAAEDLGAFELAQLWADCTAWNLNERTAYDELAELACMSALAKWLARWQPIAIHSAMLAGARPEAVAGALGNSLQVAFDRWHEWALQQRDFIIGGEPGITAKEYETITHRFAALGIGMAHKLPSSVIVSQDARSCLTAPRRQLASAAGLAATVALPHDLPPMIIKANSSHEE